MNLADFDVLTFDCYGTLIDWETGLAEALAPLVARAGVTFDRDTLLAQFGEREAAQQAAAPSMPYAPLLTAVHRQLARAWGAEVDEAESQRFGASVGDWPAFPDTPDALRYLKRHYRLVILSNVDRASFARSLPRLGVELDAVHTAEDIGSYKPDPRNFKYLLARLDEWGVPRERILHVAQSLFHDHAPANAAGLASVWIDRRGASTNWGATNPQPAGVRYDARFRTLGELAEAHRVPAER